MSSRFALAAALLLGGCAHGAPRQSAPLETPALCRAEASTEARRAKVMIEVLTNEEAQAAQFGLDSLRILGDVALPVLVCHLTDDRPLESRAKFYWLNRSEQAFEPIAHYSPDTVGQAMRMIIGAPPGTSACQDDSVEDLRVCQTAWLEHLGGR